MKFILAVSALVAAVAAQGLAGLPQCAESCALNGIGATGCQLTDSKCICEASSFLTSVKTCISTACSQADQAATLAFATKFCAAAGVTLPGSGPAAPPATSAAAPPPAPTTSAPAGSSIPVASSTMAASAMPSMASNGTSNATSTSAPATYTGGASLVQGSFVVAAFGAVMAAAL